MIKFVISFMMLLCSITVQALDCPPYSTSTEVKVNEEFSICSRQERPYPDDYDFRWTDGNRWILESYPLGDIQLISTYSTAPDAFGGDLFQIWKLKALQTGVFDLIFQLDTEKVTVTMIVD